MYKVLLVSLNPRSLVPRYNDERQQDDGVGEQRANDQEMVSEWWWSLLSLALANWGRRRLRVRFSAERIKDRCSRYLGTLGTTTMTARGLVHYPSLGTYLTYCVMSVVKLHDSTLIDQECQ